MTAASLRLGTVLLLFAAATPGCTTLRPSGLDGRGYAYLARGSGLEVVDAAGSRNVPGTEGAETFCWSRDGDGFLITHGGSLEHVDASGARTERLTGYLALRFPDMCAADGSIVVAATQTSTTAGPWRVLLLPPEGGPPRDLGAGYDPCFLGETHTVLFEDYDGGGCAIYTLDPGTLQRRRLAEGHSPSSSSDGRTAYYSSGGQLFGLRVDDPSATPDALTASGSYDRFASPSVDGTTLLFFRQRSGIDQTIELDLRTGEEREVASGQGDLPSYRPQSE